MTMPMAPTMLQSGRATSLSYLRVLTVQLDRHEAPVPLLSPDRGPRWAS